MTDLLFRVTGARVEPHAAVPTLMFGLAVDEAHGGALESVLLRCQLRIEPQRRRYSPDEEARLLDLFGEAPRWGDTLKPFLWTHVSTVIPAFTGATQVTLPVAVTYDLEVAASRYFHSLDPGGEIPVLFLFSGTIFARGEAGPRIQPVPWTKEVPFRLPVRVWRELMDAYFPNSGWLRLHRDTLDALGRFKSRRALATWDETVLALLGAGEAS